MTAAAAIAAADLTIPGPKGPLAGTLTDPSPSAPAIILVPGSGPTDRNGDSPLGVSGGIFRQLAEQLAAKDVATLRIDKRGMFGSKAAIADPNAVTIADYASDVRNWAQLLKTRGKPCAWVAGHSEGGLVALVAAQDPSDICGLILLSTPGRPVGAVMREQLKPKLPPAMFDAFDAAMVKLEQGERVDSATVPAPLAPLFAPKLQGYMTDLVGHDPARLAGATKLPMLIVQGETDIQVSTKDAKLLAAARPDARLVLLPGVNHVWRTAPADPVVNAVTYNDASLPIDPAVADAIAAFVTARD